MPHSPTRSRNHSRLMRFALPIAAALGLAIALLVTYSSPGTPDSPAPDAISDDAAAAGSFTARTITGDTVEVPGSRPSVLFFFSISCGSCGPGAQSLAEAQSQAGGQANFVVVDVVPQETDEDIEEFLTYFEADTLAYTTDPDARLMTHYQVNQVSTAVVLDASGNEVSRAVDPSPEQIRAELAKAERA